MLLFDDSKKLEKALGEEAAAVIVHIFEKVDADNKRELATKEDMVLVRADLAAAKADLEAKLRELELRLKHDLTLRLGAMMAASVAIVAALVKLL